MKVVPITMRASNAFVKSHHRHHKPVAGHKFSVGLANDNEEIVGVAIVGRPVARGADNGRTAEVTRLCTLGDRNACSMLYGAACRAAFGMGYEKVQTYILEEEDGASLRAAGFVLEGVTKGGDWNDGPFEGRRTDQPMGPKKRYARYK